MRAQVFCSAKLFASNPNARVFSDFAAQRQVNNIIEEHFCKFELTELGLSAVQLKI